MKNLILILSFLCLLCSCSNDDESTVGKENGHEWVDLGLSVKWGTCNIGATSPADYGFYYAWGELATKSSYTYANSLTYGKILPDISGNEKYDIARADRKGHWRIPTRAEMEELVNQCEWTFTNVAGRNGYKVTGSNGNSIFLPCDGYKQYKEEYLEGIGEYWTSTPHEDGNSSAYELYFCSDRHFVSEYGWYRYAGYSIRPVTDK